MDPEPRRRVRASAALLLGLAGMATWLRLGGEAEPPRGSAAPRAERLWLALEGWTDAQVAALESALEQVRGVASAEESALHGAEGLRLLEVALDECLDGAGAAAAARALEALLEDARRLGGRADRLDALEIVVCAEDEAGRRPTTLVSAVLALSRSLRESPEVRVLLPIDALALPSGAPAPAFSHPLVRQAALALLCARPELAPWIDLAKGRARLQVLLAPASPERRSTLRARLVHFDRTMLSHHALALAAEVETAHGAGPTWRRAQAAARGG